MKLIVTIINPKDMTAEVKRRIEYDGTLQAFYDLIGCNNVSIVRLGKLTEGGHEQVAVVDDEGLLKEGQGYVFMGGSTILAGTIVIASEVMTEDGPDFGDTELGKLTLVALFASGHWRFISEAEAHESLKRQIYEAIEAYRAAGLEADRVGEYGIFAHLPTDTVVH